MSELTAQVSLYPLGQDELSPAIDEAIRVFEGAWSAGGGGCDEHATRRRGSGALRSAPRGGGSGDAPRPRGEVITVSNACAVP